MASTDTPEQREERKVQAIMSIKDSMATIAKEIVALRMAAQAIAKKV